jgi:hypothetical protein
MKFKTKNPYVDFFVNSEGELIGKVRSKVLLLERAVNGISLRSSNILLFNYL